MKIRTMAAAAAALTLASAPAVAEVSFDRASAPVEGSQPSSSSPTTTTKMASAPKSFATCS